MYTHACAHRHTHTHTHTHTHAHTHTYIHIYGIHLFDYGAFIWSAQQLAAGPRDDDYLPLRAPPHLQGCQVAIGHGARLSFCRPKKMDDHGGKESLEDVGKESWELFFGPWHVSMVNGGETWPACEPVIPVQPMAQELRCQAAGSPSVAGVGKQCNYS